MVPRRRRRRPWYRRRAFRLARTALLVTVLATAWTRCGADHEHPASQRAGGQVAAASADPSLSGRASFADGSGQDPDESGRAAPQGPPPPPLPRSRPVSLRIPSLGVDAPVVGVRLDGSHQLQTPPVDKPKLVGWYEGGPTPGESGTAVAVGHRDTRTGAAVFAALGQVAPGSRIEARRTDGRTAVYTVDKVRVFDKARFPDKEVYGPSRRPELRVITCGGLFNHRTGYSSNIVVFAHLTATR
ncbi:class F sortase [Streptomyces sp. NPDC046197]|uniref:class F sortase n=1 Tax=Streptomyces sp. NPDC046197 TaxID=3154337 RepID=UPI0033C9D6CB